MRYKHKYSLLVASAALFAIPVASQDAPESLLPPGFGEPTPPVNNPPINQPPVNNPPANDPPANRSPVPQNRPEPAQPGPSSSNNNPVPRAAAPNSAPNTISSVEEADDAPVRYVVPAAQRRSLGVVGVINENQGGFNQSIFLSRDGEYLTRLTKSLKAPFLSRWGSIMTRRLLMSKTAAPENVDGADWVAERAWLLLRMGESVNARSLIQQVDAGQYSNRLYQVAMPTLLANGDLAGFCPFADAAARKTDANSWKMSRVICLSLSGEQSRATSLLNRARRGQWATGVDYLLAEKAIGAGTNGRRAVKIEWDGVQGFNAWRHGLSLATGVKPPERFYNISGRHVRSWLVLAPMVPVNDRIVSSYAAAANGTLSNAAMVDLFASAEEDENASADTKEKIEFLNRAYTSDLDGRMAAMKSLWNSRDNDVARYSMRLLTARAAARIMPASMASEDVDLLVASMMTAGLDTQSLKWLDFADVGTLAWAQIMVGANVDRTISLSDIDDFYSQDDSLGTKKTSFLIAAAGGLGRLEAGSEQEIFDQYDASVRKENRWSMSLDKALTRGDNGAVILLVAAGLQGSDWSKLPAFHIYHIVKALNAIGLNAEARMIAAEAIDRA